VRNPVQRGQTGLTKIVRESRTHVAALEPRHLPENFSVAAFTFADNHPVTAGPL
jgi:hypothetical protein